MFDGISKGQKQFNLLKEPTHCSIFPVAACANPGFVRKDPRPDFVNCTQYQLGGHTLKLFTIGLGPVLVDMASFQGTIKITFAINDFVKHGQNPSSPTLF